jgi:chromosomal replication initiation ATPase DnaA
VLGGVSLSRIQGSGPSVGLFTSASREEVRGRSPLHDVLLLRPDLKHTYEKYLTQAHCEETPEGLVISVPTTFHATGLHPILATIEEALNKPIVSVQIRRARPAAPTASTSTPNAHPAPTGVAGMMAMMGLPMPASAPRRAPAPNFDQPAGPLQVPLPFAHRKQEAVDPLKAEKERRSPPPPLVLSPATSEPFELLKRWSQGVNFGMRSQCLWVHGESGSGKTWLVKQLHSLVRLEKRLHFVDVMSFLHEWRKSIESRDQLSFIRKYRKEVDVLVLENLDDLQGKTGTQQELLFTVGAMLERGASIVVTSHANPLAMQETIEASLFSRLHSGLSIEMARPDRAFKEQLWRSLLTQHGLAEASVSLPVLERILSIPAGTVRKANSLFINVITRLSYNRNLDVSDIVELATKHSTPIAMLPQYSPMDVMERVAKLCGLGVAAIQGRIRRPDVSLARRFVCLALSRYLGLTNSVIATFVEKDPSTVSHALKLVEEELANNRRIAQQWNYICCHLGMQPISSNGDA